MMSIPIPMTIQNFELRDQRGIEFFVNTQLETAGFKNAFSTRSAGTAANPENRARFLAAIGASSDMLVISKQVHSADVRVVTDLLDASSPPSTGDAIITRQRGVFLGVQTADCLPVLIGDERTRAFAAVHAGWRGTLRGIVARTLESMQHEYGTRTQDVTVAIGPGLQNCCFEVGPEVEEAFSETFSYGRNLFSREAPDKKGHLDVIRANSQQLVEMGVRQDRIYVSDLCTKCGSDMFFSHRGERRAENLASGHGGRMIGVIGID